MNKFDKQLSRQLWMQYILALLAWAFGLLLLGALLWYFYSIASWDDSEPIYSLIVNANLKLSIFGETNVIFRRSV